MIQTETRRATVFASSVRRDHPGMTDIIDKSLLGQASVSELLGLYSAVITELRARDVLRTNNPPVGDYAEWLVARAFEVPRLEANSTASYDLVCEEFGKVQVKGRVVTPGGKPGELQSSPFRSDKFDHAGLVLLNQADYSVVSAVMLPVAAVKERWKKRSHTNSHVLFMNGPTMNHPTAVDIADRLREAALLHG